MAGASTNPEGSSRGGAGAGASLTGMSPSLKDGSRCAALSSGEPLGISRYDIREAASHNSKITQLGSETHGFMCRTLQLVRVWPCMNEPPQAEACATQNKAPEGRPRGEEQFEVHCEY